MLNIGNLVPASYMKFGEEYPDLFKYYSAYPESTTQSSAANKRRPHLFTSFSGASWGDETSGNVNFYFEGSNSLLKSFSHKSLSDSYSSYPATATSPIILSVQGWAAGTAIPRSTANQISRYVTKSHSVAHPNRYFCVKVGGAYAYNENPLNTPNWTVTDFGTGYSVKDDSNANFGAFKICAMDKEADHEMMVLFINNTTDLYHRICLVNTDNLTVLKDFTSTVLSESPYASSTYKNLSVDYLPGIGYLFVYRYANTNGFRSIMLYTYNQATGERLSYNDYYVSSVGSITNSNNTPVALGMRGQYCPWTKEYFLAPNIYQVFWTKDGINWTGSTTTGKAATGKCQKLFVNNSQIVMAVDALNWVFSQDKGQTWETLSKGTSTSSTQGIFYPDRSNDTITLPFKCKNNIGINKDNVTLGYWLNTTDGSPTASAANFYTNDYITVDPNTSYVFYGINDQSKTMTRNARFTWYNSSKTWIKTDEGTSFISGNYQPCIRTSPSNAAYVRMSCRPLPSGTVTQAAVDSYKWYFAKESDFEVVTKYGDLSGN